MSDNVEKRKHRRVAIDWPLDIITGHGIIEGEVKNISSDGMYICCRQPLKLNEKIRTSIKPPEHEDITIAGNVIWSDLCGMDDDYNQVGFGICFVEISDQSRAILQDLK
ncbi:PilZ domain-containing protein [Thermodesulfobacteriota bacterium]